MDTKVSWPTVFGIAILGSVIVFAIASLPMNHWLDGSDRRVDLASDSSKAKSNVAVSETPFEFPPVEIAVGSSARVASPESSITSSIKPSFQSNSSSNFPIENESPSISPSGNSEWLAKQEQADRLLEVAESLVLQSTSEKAKDSSTDYSAKVASDFNPIASLPSEMLPSELLAENPLSAQQQTMSLSGALEFPAKLPGGSGLPGNSGLSSNGDGLANSANASGLDSALAKRFQSELRLESDRSVANSPLSDEKTDLTPRDIEMDNDLRLPAIDDSAIGSARLSLNAQSQVTDSPELADREADLQLGGGKRIKAQTVSQSVVRSTPESTHDVDFDSQKTASQSAIGPELDYGNGSNLGGEKPATSEVLPGMIPMPSKLLSELDHAKRSYSPIAQWAIAYKLAIGQLCNSQPGQQRESLNQLENLRLELDFLIQKNSTSSGTISQLTELRQLCYSLDRRLDFWQATIPGNPILAERQKQQSSRIQLIRSRRWNFDSVNISAQWSQYLMWPQLVSVINDSQVPKADKQAYSREILTRINSGTLNFQQEAVISQLLPLDLQRQLYVHANLKVEPVEVLNAIESYEEFGDSLSAMRIMEGYRWLRLSDQVADQQIVALIENHYRNANVRFTASREFINRWFVSQAWVNQTIARQKENHVGIGVMPFQIDLIPSEEGFHFQLNPAGQDEGTSEGWKSSSPPTGDEETGILSVSFRNDDQSPPLPTDGRFENYQGGRYAQMPFADWVLTKYPEGLAVGTKAIPIKQEVRSQSQLATELNQQLARQMQQTEQAIGKTIRGFQLAGLSPQVIENSSTADAITARFRIADNTQLASNTARPNPTRSALLSLQVHQTLINNTLQRIEVAGKTFSWQSLTQHLGRVAGLDLNSLAMDVAVTNRDQLEFAPQQAIEVSFDHEQIRVAFQLNNARLGSIETGPIAIATWFDVEVNGCNVAVSRDVRQGWTIQSQLLSASQFQQVSQHLNEAIGAVEARITPTSWETDFLAKQLHIAKLELTDGWLSVSVEAATESNAIALTQNEEQDHQATPASNNRLIRAFLSDSEPKSARSLMEDRKPVLRSVLE